MALCGFREGREDPAPRRTALRIGAAGTAAVLGAATLRSSWPPHAATQPQLHSHTVALTDARALTSGGHRRLVSRLEDLVEGRRITADATGRDALIQVEEELLGGLDVALAAGPAWGNDFRDLARSAALDIHVLSAGLAAPVAGWSAHWRYVWPRDTAHIALALHLMGRDEQARRAARELARLCGDDGWFEARYLPSSTHTPDGRERQLDGTGWFLWMCAELAELPGLLEDPVVRAAITRCTTTLRQLTDTDRWGRHLPPPSPDYWERSERRLTIATAALVQVGLERGAHLLERLGSPDAEATARRAAEVAQSVHEVFGPADYGRYPQRGLWPSPADAGMMFLLPPYAHRAAPEVAHYLVQTEESARRPAGGIAPGAGWKRDGISWTPQTAMLAQAYRTVGADDEAARLLRWLSAHRTAAGSIPEKVLDSGTPAAVAPLGWPAAVVLMTLLRTS